MECPIPVVFVVEESMQDGLPTVMEGSWEVRVLGVYGSLGAAQAAVAGRYEVAAWSLDAAPDDHNVPYWSWHVDRAERNRSISIDIIPFHVDGARLTLAESHRLGLISITERDVWRVTGEERLGRLLFLRSKWLLIGFLVIKSGSRTKSFLLGYKALFGY